MWIFPSVCWVLHFEGSHAKMDKLKEVRKRGAFLRTRVTQLMHWLWAFRQSSIEVIMWFCIVLQQQEILSAFEPQLNYTKGWDTFCFLLLMMVHSRVGFWAVTWIMCWIKHFFNADKEQETIAGQALVCVSEFLSILWFKDWHYIQGFVSGKSNPHITKKKAQTNYIKSFRLFWPARTLRKQIIMHCYWWSGSWSN